MLYYIKFEGEIEMEKYAALIKSSYNVPGDERSQQFPGHGYPAHTVSYTDVKEFESFDDMLSWVNREVQSGRKTEYRIIRYEEFQIVTKTTVEVTGK